MKTESKRANSFKLFWNAIKGSGRDIWTSLQVILAITVVLAIIFYIFEHQAQPEEYGFWQSIWWALLRYIGDPGKFAQVAPVTIVGRIIAMLIGILGILIFAIPAGVIGARFRKAIDDDKRQKELQSFRSRLTKSFRRVSDKTLRSYLNSLPDKGGEKFKKLNFVPRVKNVSTLQVNQGMNINDVMDTCANFNEFRFKNQASVFSIEENPTDRFLVENFPLNRKYGCCINRGSKVTIFSTSSSTEVGCGWFSYYLAKMGGFNYISKDIDADPDELDSFFNISDEPLCDKRKKSEWKEMDKKKYEKSLSQGGFNVLTSYDDAIKILDKKIAAREEFFNDCKELLKDKGSWLILFNDIIKNSENENDFIFADITQDGKLSTVIDENLYKLLYEKMSELLSKELELKSSLRPQRYSLLKKNVLFYLQEKDYIGGNGFALRVSSKLINADIHRLVAAYLMAKVISEQLDDNRGMRDYDRKDFASTGFGYQILDETNAE